MRGASPAFVVCIPARDEARRIPRVLAALGAQTGLGGAPVTVVVAANNCADATAERARAAAREAGLRALVLERRWERSGAGRARRAAMEAGAELLGGAGALLTTDADAEPDPDWIANSLAALEAGADAVGSALRGFAEEEARFPPALRRIAEAVAEAQRLAIALEDLIDPVPGDRGPRHGDHYGAGLAISLAAYRAAGGCPPVASREDVRLVQAVRRAGGVVRHCPACRVAVSARMRGRASGGMADTIRDWAEAARRGALPAFPDPAQLEAAWRRRAARRAELEAAFGALPDTIRRRRVAAALARSCPPPVRTRSAPVDRAADALAARLSALEVRHAAA